MTFHFLFFYIRNLERLIKCCFSIKNHYIKEFLAEFLGTLLLVLFGCGSVAQYRLRKEESNSNPILLTINLAFGFGLTLGILITSKISGININNIEHTIYRFILSIISRWSFKSGGFICGSTYRQN